MNIWSLQWKSGVSNDILGILKQNEIENLGISNENLGFSNEDMEVSNENMGVSN